MSRAAAIPASTAPARSTGGAGSPRSWPAIAGHAASASRRARSMHDEQAVVPGATTGPTIEPVAVKTIGMCGRSRDMSGATRRGSSTWCARTTTDARQPSRTASSVTRRTGRPASSRPATTSATSGASSGESTARSIGVGSGVVASTGPSSAMRASAPPRGTPIACATGSRADSGMPRCSSRRSVSCHG